MRFNGSSIFTSIKLKENSVVPKEVQVLRVGKFNHPKYGAFEITMKTLSEMKSNFDNNIRGLDMSFDYFHDSDKEASAWVNSIDLRNGGQELWANVDWTPKAETKLSERELRYFSPDFAFSYIDPEKGIEFSNVLFGGGLTNRPFVKEMQPIVASENINENKGSYQMDPKDKMIADLQAKIAELEAKIKGVAPALSEDDKAAALKLQSDMAAKDEENKKLLAENASLKDAKKLADEAKVLVEKESAFTLLLTEGKACVAQKEAFLKGDMTEFIKLAQPLNLKASGSSTSTTGEVDTDAIIKLAEEKQKLDPKLNRGDAISMAMKELKK